MPNLSHTRLCEDFQNGQCNNPNCTYAHQYAELRSTDFCFKTSICAWYTSGKCRNGSHCRFAHGENDLRVKDAGAEKENMVMHGRTMQQAAKKERGPAHKATVQASTSIKAPPNSQLSNSQLNSLGYGLSEDAFISSALSQYKANLDEQTVHERTLEYMRNPEYAKFVDSIISASTGTGQHQRPQQMQSKTSWKSRTAHPPSSAAVATMQGPYPGPHANMNAEETAMQLSMLAQKMSSLSMELSKLEARIQPEDQAGVVGSWSGGTRSGGTTSSSSSPASADDNEFLPVYLTQPNW
jgi:hypothetical protein